jgi:hypothetical protein
MVYLASGVEINLRDSIGGTTLLRKTVFNLVTSFLVCGIKKGRVKGDRYYSTSTALVVVS